MQHYPTFRERLARPFTRSEKILMGFSLVSALVFMFEKGAGG